MNLKYKSKPNILYTFQETGKEGSKLLAEGQSDTISFFSLGKS